MGSSSSYDKPRRGKTLHPSHWKALKEQGFLERKTLTAGRVIGRAGKRLDGLYFIKSGVVWTADPQDSRLARAGVALRQGDVLGAASVIEDAFADFYGVTGAPSWWAARSVPGTRFGSAYEMWTTRAVTDVVVHYLPARKYRQAVKATRELLRDGEADLDGFVKSHLLVSVVLPDLLEAMKRHPRFRWVSNRHVVDLLLLGQAFWVKGSKSPRVEQEPARASDHLHPPKQGEAVSRFELGEDFYYVVDSELKVVDSTGETKKGRDGREHCICPLVTGSWFGGFEGAESELTLASDHDCLIVRLSAEDIGYRMERSPSFLEYLALEYLATPKEMYREVIALIVKHDAKDAIDSPIVELLAQTMAKDVPVEELPWAGFPRSNVGVIRLVRNSTDEPFEPITTGGVNRINSTRDGLGAAFGRLDASQAYWAARRKVSAIFIDPCEFTHDEYLKIIEDWQAQQLAQQARFGIDRVVFLSTNSFDDLPTPQKRSPFRYLPIVRSVLLGRRNRTTEPAHYPRSVRLRINDIENLAFINSLDQLTEGGRQTFSRWVRGIMERRIGVALGGGGAWGYAHLALLEAMADEEIPVDLISGSSFGALVGAFFAVGGAKKLETLITESSAVNLMLLAGTISSRAISWYVDAQLGGRCLQDLEIPFLPVGLNLEENREFTPTTGSVGFGVRTSSTPPALFTPATGRGFRTVDGGFINNVPEGILYLEGADIIISSNVVEPPPRAPQGSGLFYEFNPVQRFLDGLRATQVLTQVADDRDQDLANATFRPPRTNCLPTALGKGNAIRENARDRAGDFVRELKTAWQTDTPLGWAELHRRFPY